MEIDRLVGRECIGGKVKDKVVGVRDKVESGEEVEIVSWKREDVEEEWVKLVSWGKGKRKIVGMVGGD